jgi:hypothetical protein
MQLAVGGSAALVFLVALTPGVQEIFNCATLTRCEWLVVAALTAVPAVVEELTKAYYRATGYGLRVGQVYVVDGVKPAASKKSD